MTQEQGATIRPPTFPITSTDTSSGIDTHDADQAPLDKSDRPSFTDTIAAVTIAILACVLIITVALIIRALHRRRIRERGRELNVIPTISTGIVSASVNAYGGQNTPRPVDGVISWEPVASSSHDTDATTDSVPASLTNR